MNQVWTNPLQVALATSKEAALHSNSSRNENCPNALRPTPAKLVQRIVPMLRCSNSKLTNMFMYISSQKSVHGEFSARRRNDRSQTSKVPANAKQEKYYS